MKMNMKICFMCSLLYKSRTKELLFGIKEIRLGGTNTIATQHEYIICNSKGNVKLYVQHLSTVKQYSENLFH